MGISKFFRKRPPRAEGQKAEDSYTVHKAVIDACYLWRGAGFEEMLRRDMDWRQARSRIRGRDPFHGRWTARVSGRAMRLTNRGLEVRFTHGLHCESWKAIQDRIHWWRN